MTERDTAEADRLLGEARRQKDRRLAFIAGYGAALSDIDDVSIGRMSKQEFSEHIRALFQEFEDD